ncbi:hypothetical protein AAEH95_15915 [Shewanella xiamenensis]|uniref:hypothetical protein n=1 Tax=Shewanella xiamenensis TaxID=332186 RepID=UPI00313BE634
MNKISILGMCIVLALSVAIGLAVDFMFEFWYGSIFTWMNVFSFKLLILLISMILVYVTIAISFNFKLLSFFVGKEYPANYFAWSKFRNLGVFFLFGLWIMGDLKYFTIVIVNFALVELIHLYLVCRNINNKVESTI